MSQKFQKNKEDFTCEKCGFFVVGSGYTNHCTKCLWSKHVDIYPGDRAGKCCGLMKPIKIESEKGEFIIIHECQKCGVKKKNKTNKEDDLNILFDKKDI